MFYLSGFVMVCVVRVIGAWVCSAWIRDDVTVISCTSLHSVRSKRCNMCGNMICGVFWEPGLPNSCKPDHKANKAAVISRQRSFHLYYGYITTRSVYVLALYQCQRFQHHYQRVWSAGGPAAIPEAM